MTLDTTITCLALAVVAIAAMDLVLLHHHRRAARSRRLPVVLFDTQRSDR